MLRKLQASVIDALLSQNPSGAAEWLSRDQIPRLQIYTNNIREAFTRSLESSYPVVLRLVGAAYFRQTCRAFQEASPSRNGDLQPAGAALPAFLNGLFAGTEFHFVAEVARFEWLRQEVLLGGDSATLDLSRLREVPAHWYERLTFSLHPTARLFASAYPCAEIWEANIDLSNEPEVIDLQSREDYMVLWRSDSRLRGRRLSETEYVFLEAIQQGKTLGEAISIFGGPNVSGATGVLQSFVQLQIIVDFQSPSL